METLPGVEVPTAMLPQHRRVSDLQYFEGPLLTEFRDDRGDRYLYYWCDCDSSANRWLVISVSYHELILLKWLMISIYELLTTFKLETVLYVLDIDSKFHRKRLSVCRVKDLPDSYIPDQASLLDINVMPTHDDNLFPILLKGSDWEVDELAKLPRKFSDLYALQYYYRNDGRARFTRRPHKGGYSTLHFYNELRGFVGAKYLPTVSRMAFASPGFIEFRANPEIASQVARTVLAMRRHRDDLEDLYGGIEQYIKELGVNKEPGEARLDKASEEYLIEQSRNLLSILVAPPWEWLLGVSGSVFEATKEAMAHFRRVQDLDNLVISGRISFEHIERVARAPNTIKIKQPKQVVAGGDRSPGG